jgi:hypothetical protein
MNSLLYFRALIFVCEENKGHVIIETFYFNGFIKHLFSATGHKFSNTSESFSFTQSFSALRIK